MPDPSPHGSTGAALALSENGQPTRPITMTAPRQYKFQKGDWIASRNGRGEWVLAGKIVDADSKSCTAEYRGLRSHWVPGEDAIVRVRWVGRGKWTIS